MAIATEQKHSFITSSHGHNVLLSLPASKICFNKNTAVSLNPPVDSYMMLNCGAKSSLHTKSFFQFLMIFHSCNLLLVHSSSGNSCLTLSSAEICASTTFIFSLLSFLSSSSEFTYT